jgi:tetratricopeptide (TPR) repeat protein
MANQQKPPLGFVQNRMPWLVLAGALIVYLLTLNHWLRIEGLSLVARIPGWDWMPVGYTPILDALCYPFHWLPLAWQPLALNVLAAVLAALTLALLARTVALLPYDRTTDERARERSEFSLLSTSKAWAPPLLAVLLCGLHRAFWEHATAMTGAMLNLLMQAYIIRCLLEFRLARQDSWLYRAALVFGLAITNHHGMIPLLPCFLVAVVWVKGFEFWQLRFIGRLLVWGLAGLLAYFLLPLAALVGGQDGTHFWEFVRAILIKQRYLLGTVPPFVGLILSFTSLLPLLVRSIRWPSPAGDTLAAAYALTRLITRVVYGLILVLPFLIFLEAKFIRKWTPLGLAPGLPFLSYYYLVAIYGAYALGYFLLLFRSRELRPWQRPSLTAGFLSKSLSAAVLLALVAVPSALVWMNLPLVRRNNGEALARFAKLTVRSLPGGPAYLLNDDFHELCLVEAALRRERGRHPYVMVHTGLLGLPGYHEQLARCYPQRWPLLTNLPGARAFIENGLQARLLTRLALSNQVYYLHPSMGFFFETLYLEPHGMALRMKFIPTNAVAPPELSEGVLLENQQFWNAVWPELDEMPPSAEQQPPEMRMAGELSARALDYWGVLLQRAGRLEEAAKCFTQALRLHPANFSASVNLKFNKRLRQTPLAPVDLAQPLAVNPQFRTLDQLLLYCGPIDEPVWCFNLGQVYAQSGLYRQALLQFERLHKLYPDNQTARVWYENMRTMTYFSLGNRQAAERMALDLQRQFPREESVLETLTQMYMLAGRPTNALLAIDQQLQLNPSNQFALLNKAYLNIQVKAFDQAIPPLDMLLQMQPGLPAALMNRAIAYLQLGKLDQAQQDYEAVRKQWPTNYAVYYGLAEIASRRKNDAEAFANYQQYLKYGLTNSAEYKRVAERVKQLKAAGVR